MTAWQAVSNVCREFGLDVAAVRSSSRHAVKVRQRRIVVLALKDKFSTPELGFALGRDHSTVVNLYRPKSSKRRREVRELEIEIQAARANRDRAVMAEAGCGL